MAEVLNLYQKLAKIRKQVEVVQKNKSGYGYKYVTDDELLAKITVGMDKYGVSLVPNIVPGTLKVEPYTYKKTKREKQKENDLLSPIYTTAARGGCWFCHNQGVEQLRLLRKNYPDLWALLLKWDADSPITFHPRGRTVAHFETRFQMEDDGKLVAGDKRFRWAQVLPNLRKDNIHENYPES